MRKLNNLWNYRFPEKFKGVWGDVQGRNNTEIYNIGWMTRIFRYISTHQFIPSLCGHSSVCRVSRAYQHKASTWNCIYECYHVISICGRTICIKDSFLFKNQRGKVIDSKGKSSASNPCQLHPIYFNYTAVRVLSTIWIRVRFTFTKHINSSSITSCKDKREREIDREREML